MKSLMAPLRARLTAPHRVGPIGLAFDDEWVHLAQFDRKQGMPHLRHARSVRCASGGSVLEASPGEFASVVREALKQSKFKGRRVVTDVPPQDLRLMVLSYGLENPEQEAETILSLVRERMQGDLDEYVVDYVPIRTSGHQRGDHSALVAIAQEDRVVEHLERLRALRLDVAALEIPPVAIRRIVNCINDGSNAQVALIVRIGERGTELTLLSGRRLLLYRAVEIGMQSILDNAAKSLDCDPEAAGELLTLYGVGEAPVTEILPSESGDAELELEAAADIVGTLREILRPCLRPLVEQAHKAISYAAFQTRGMSLDRVVLIEGVRSCPGLELLLADMLQLPVERFLPSQIVPGFDEVFRKGSGQRLTTALGFALRGMVDG